MRWEFLIYQSTTEHSPEYESKCDGESDGLVSGKDRDHHDRRDNDRLDWRKNPVLTAPSLQSELDYAIMAIDAI